VWIADAKTDQTPQKRIDEALEWIAQGKGRFWKYEKKCVGADADQRLSHGKRAERGVRLECRRVPTGSPHTRRMAQIGIGANSLFAAKVVFAQEDKPQGHSAQEQMA
ncbi:MAG: YdeI/OmpD-associated family protein, partial [Thiomonas sp.]